MKKLTLLLITTAFILTNCGWYKRSDIKDNPVNVKERVQKNIEGGRGIRFGKGGSDGMLVKFDSNGEKEWEKLYGGKGLDYFRSIIRDTKKGYIVSGGTRSFSNGDNQAWILSVDDNGYISSI